MAKVTRPAQGNNTNRRIVKRPAGGDNINASGSKRAPKVNNRRPRGYA